MSDKSELLIIGIVLAIVVISAILANDYLSQIEAFWNNKLPLEATAVQLTGEEVVSIRQLYASLGKATVFLAVSLTLLISFIIDLAWERTKRS